MKIAPISVKLYAYSQVLPEFATELGSDDIPVFAARQSVNSDDIKKTSSSERLMKYLNRENHTIPFCHATASLVIQVPIFLARQLDKSRVGASWSEASRRYIKSEPTIWMPTRWRKAPPDNIKQGSGECLEEELQELCNKGVVRFCNRACDNYERMLELGVAPEQARMILPQNMMTQALWTGSLRFWARVYKLRTSDHAQKDLKEFTGQLDREMRKAFPVAWDILINEERKPL